MPPARAPLLLSPAFPASATRRVADGTAPLKGARKIRGDICAFALALGPLVRERPRPRDQLGVGHVAQHESALGAAVGAIAAVGAAGGHRAPPTRSGGAG